MITCTSVLGFVGLPEDVQKLSSLLAFIGEGGAGWVVPTLLGLALLLLPADILDRTKSAPGASLAEGRSVSVQAREPRAERTTEDDLAPEVGKPAPASVPEPTTAPQVAPQPTPNPGDKRMFVDATPEELVKFYEDHIDIRADKLAQPYIGRWIQVSGPLQNAAPEEKGGVRACIHTYDPFMWIFMDIPAPGSVDVFAVKKQGSPVTVNGQIKRIGPHDLILENCELVDQP